MKAKLVGGPKDGWVYEVPDAITTIAIEGIDYQEGVPLPEQKVIARPGEYLRISDSDTFRWEERQAVGVLDEAAKR